MLAPMVMAMRMPIMSAEAAGSMLSGRPESMGAVTEKLAAFAEGAAAAQLAWWRGAMLFPLAMSKTAASSRHLVELAGDMTIAALTPAAKQVGRNHRRLSRPRKR
jgi:hypothetical protein